jgi:hypothetical protein
VFVLTGVDPNRSQSKFVSVRNVRLVNDEWEGIGRNGSISELKCCSGILPVLDGGKLEMKIIHS